MQKRKNLRLVAMAGLIAMTLTEGVWAGDWNQTFGTGVSGVERKAVHMVVPAGSEAAETRLACAALAEAWRKAGVATVMTSDSIGDVSALDDAQIVSRASAAAERIAVVRVFRGEGGAPPSVVAVVYDRSGKALTAMSGTKGEPIAARPTGPASAGVSSDVLAAVATVDAVDDKKKAALDEFAKKVVWIESSVLSVPGRVFTWSTVYKGVSGMPVARPEDFYRAIERDEEARAFHAKRIGSGVLRGVGIAAMAGGGIMGFVYGIKKSSYETDVEDCDDTILGEYDSNDCDEAEKPSGALLGAGVTLGIAGLATMITGFVLRPHLPRTEEVEKMTKEYNTALRSRLGLSEEDGNRVFSDRKSVRFSLTPTTSAFGVGLGLSGTFGMEAGR